MYAVIGRVQIKPAQEQAISRIRASRVERGSGGEDL